MKYLIPIGILAAFLRGLAVFDMGPSAHNSYPTASAICFVGSILCAILYVRSGKMES